MQIFKLITVAVLGASVAACGHAPDIASRNAPFEALPPTGSVQQTGLPQFQSGALTPLPLSVTDIRIAVPSTLSVSEANTFYPRGDIVWRGDPIGNRKAQIATIMQTAFREGTKDMDGATAVTLDVEIVRFHSVTEKTRYSVGGVHNIIFKLTVRRASTGEALAPAHQVTADLPALGGRSAIEADRQGQTQKVRVTGHLQQVIQNELARFVSS